MGKFLKKTDWLGRTTYYDSKGVEIGKEDRTWHGETVIRNRSGQIVGRPRQDYLCRDTIELESKGLFGTKTTLIRDNEPEDWEFCDKCGEWDGGDDDCDCEDW